MKGSSAIHGAAKEVLSEHSSMNHTKDEIIIK